MGWLTVWAIVTVAIWYAGTSFRRSIYPLATELPDPPDIALSEVLQQLDQRIEEHAPERFAALQSGLSKEEISAIEREYGLRLTDDLRQLYQWHDGIDLEAGQTLFGIHQFYPLEDVAKTRVASEQELARTTFVQYAFYWVFCGHQKPWFELFPDGAGDGFFVDPTRKPCHGSVFYNFNEDREYNFYPNLASLMLAISECYDAGLHDQGRDDTSVATIQKEMDIHAKHSVSNH